MKSLVDFIKEAKENSVLDPFNKITQVIFNIIGTLAFPNTKPFKAVDEVVKKQKLTTVEAYANPEFKDYLTPGMRNNKITNEYLKFNKAFDAYIKEYDTEAKDTVKEIYKDDEQAIKWGWYNDTTFIAYETKPDEEGGSFPILFVCH